MQGKAWNKDEVTELLKPYLQLGYSVNKACKLVGIPQQTVDTWIQNDELLQLKVESWRNELNIQARKQWEKAIKEGVPTKYGPDTYGPAKDWLERMERDEFSTKQNVDITSKDEKLDAGIFVGDLK